VERDDRAELLRLRDRVHKLGGSFAGVLQRLRAVEAWQRRYGPVIETMSRSDEIAAGVAEELRRRGSAQFTLWQKLAALVVAASALAGVILQAAHGL
jgi:hypothetical protein